MGPFLINMNNQLVHQSSKTKNERTRYDPIGVSHKKVLFKTTSGGLVSIVKIKKKIMTNINILQRQCIKVLLNKIGSRYGIYTRQ